MVPLLCWRSLFLSWSIQSTDYCCPPLSCLFWVGRSSSWSIPQSAPLSGCCLIYWNRLRSSMINWSSSILLYFFCISILSYCASYSICFLFSRDSRPNWVWFLSGACRNLYILLALPLMWGAEASKIADQFAFSSPIFGLRLFLHSESWWFRVHQAQ